MIGSAMLMAASFAAGGALGAAHFALLHGAVQSLTQDIGAARGIPWQIARFVLTAAGFWALARIGAGALLCGLAGFQAARGMVLRREARP